VLELGSYLVNELGFSKGVDTLGRWLSHRLAELVTEAQKRPRSKSQKEAEGEAVQTILKIWDKRAILPGRTNPLADYKEVLAILYKFRPNRSVWEIQSRDPIETAIFDLRHRLSRLTQGLLLLKVQPSTKKTSKYDQIVAKFLSQNERDALKALRIMFVDGSTPKPSESEPVTLSSALQQLIDETVSELHKVRALVSAHPNPSPRTPRPKARTISRRP
jgi:hypothetical protein